MTEADSTQDSGAWSGRTPENEASLNGGLALPLPPVARSLRLSRLGGWITLFAEGWNLDGVSAIRFRSADLAQMVPFQVISSRPGAILARGYSGQIVPGGHVLLISESGGIAAHEVAGEADTTRLAYARDRILLRAFPDQVVLPSRERPAPLAECRISARELADSLRACGITSLAAALPTFSMSDVHSTNLQGDAVTLDDLTSLLVAQTDPEFDPRALAARVSRLPGILYAEPDHEILPTLAPNDSLYGQQWGLHAVGTTFCGMTATAASMILAESAWDQTTGRATVPIAILDSGIDQFHPDLLTSTWGPRVKYGPSYDPGATIPVDDHQFGHGTAVTGIAAAMGNNGIGSAGVAWNVVPWAVKIFAPLGMPGYLSWLIAGIDWARSQRIPIVNISGGYTAAGLRRGSRAPERQPVARHRPASD